MLKKYTFAVKELQSHVADISYFKSPIKKYVENPKWIFECLVWTAVNSVCASFLPSTHPQEYTIYCASNCECLFLTLYVPPTLKNKQVIFIFQ